MSKQYRKYLVSKTSEVYRAIQQKAAEWNSSNISTTAFPKVMHTEITGSDDWKLERIKSIDDEIDSYQEKYRHIIEERTSIESLFQEQQFEQYQIFREKNRYYGMNNISGGDDVDMTDPSNINASLEGICYRLRDKMQRIATMLKNNHPDNDETLIDTLNDISNYANIAITVKRGKWLEK